MKVWSDVATIIKIALACVIVGMTLGFCLAGGA